MGTRRHAREVALQALYLVDVSQLEYAKALQGLDIKKKPDKKTSEFAERLTRQTLEYLSDIDTVIKKYTNNWDMKRMAVLDRNILRLGTYEIMFEMDTPISVIIDEAVEIAKTYSTSDSGKFVNGILDKVKKERKKK